MPGMARIVQDVAAVNNMLSQFRDTGMADLLQTAMLQQCTSLCRVIQDHNGPATAADVANLVAEINRGIWSQEMKEQLCTAASGMHVGSGAEKRNATQTVCAES